jgi:hypothetical protein
MRRSTRLPAETVSALHGMAALNNHGRSPNPEARLTRVGPLPNGRLALGADPPCNGHHRHGNGRAESVMMESDAPEPEPSRPQAANDNGASPASIDARILTIARALGRQIAREQLRKMPAANDNGPGRKR